MHRFFVALVAAAAWSDAGSDLGFVEPGEHAMREAFALNLQQRVRQVLAYVEQTGGEDAVRRVREARTDAFRLLDFRKVECRRSEDRTGHICDFAVEVDTVAGPIGKSIKGRFFNGPYGLAYDADA